MFAGIRGEPPVEVVAQAVTHCIRVERVGGFHGAAVGHGGASCFSLPISQVQDSLHHGSLNNLAQPCTGMNSEDASDHAGYSMLVPAPTYLPTHLLNQGRMREKSGDGELNALLIYSHAWQFKSSMVRMLLLQAFARRALFLRAVLMVFVHNMPTAAHYISC